MQIYVTDRSVFRDRRCPTFWYARGSAARLRNCLTQESRLDDLSWNRLMEFARYESKRRRERWRSTYGGTCVCITMCSPINQSIGEEGKSWIEAKPRVERWNVISFRGSSRSFLRSVHVNWPRDRWLNIHRNERKRGEKQELLKLEWNVTTHRYMHLFVKLDWYPFGLIAVFKMNDALQFVQRLERSRCNV